MRFLLALLMFALFWPLVRGLGRLLGAGGSTGSRSKRSEADPDDASAPNRSPRTRRNDRKARPDVIDVTYEDVP